MCDASRALEFPCFVFSMCSLLLLLACVTSSVVLSACLCWYMCLLLFVYVSCSIGKCVCFCLYMCLVRLVYVSASVGIRGPACILSGHVTCVMRRLSVYVVPRANTFLVFFTGCVAESGDNLQKQATLGLVHSPGIHAPRAATVKTLKTWCANEKPELAGGSWARASHSPCTCTETASECRRGRSGGRACVV